MGVWFWIVVGIFMIIVLYFSVGLIAAVTMTRVGDHPQYDYTPMSYGLDYSTVQLTSRVDNLELAAWYLPHQDAKRAMILVHGRDASKQNAISGRLPALAAELHHAGLAVLMLDLRGHGESEGKRYTWGVFERRDVLGAVDFLEREGFSPAKIALLGISLGGAAVVGAALESPAVGGVVLDSTFADLEALVKPNWRNESGLPTLFLLSAFMMWQALYRFDLRKVNPARELAQMRKRPVLILHSRSDETVPVEHGLQLAEATPQGKLVLFDGCDHAELFRDAPEQYLQALDYFLNEMWVENDQ
jgi:alpha-beta hydrolase superfamily lysophospholipase